MIRIFNRKYSKKTMLLISEIIISFLGLLTFPIKGEQAWFIAFFIFSAVSRASRGCQCQDEDT